MIDETTGETIAATTVTDSMQIDERRPGSSARAFFYVGQNGPREATSAITSLRARMRAA